MELMERISCHYQAAGINENMAEVCIVHMYFTAVPKIGDSTDSLSFFFLFFCQRRCLQDTISGGLFFYFLI